MNKIIQFLKQTIFRIIPTDVFSKRYPISVKGVVFVNDKIILLKNERNEWELPGGKIEVNETTEQCTIREIKEELNIDVSVHSLVDVWMYNILGKVNVLIITYLCNPLKIDEATLKISNEHEELGIFRLDEINNLNIPKGYKNSIEKASVAIKKVNL